MTSDQQTQPHIPNEHPSATAYQQRQRQLPHRRLSTSACRSIASVFSTQADQVDAIELKQYTKKLPQTHNYHGGHDEDLQGGQETQDSCSHESGNTDTGVTTPELEEFPKEVSQAPRTVTSTGSPAGHLPSRLSTFWGKNISIIVPSKDARDHLGPKTGIMHEGECFSGAACVLSFRQLIRPTEPRKLGANDKVRKLVIMPALERTYLSYHRTSLIFAILATIVAQLTVINHSPSPSVSFGFHVLGKPLAVVLASCAVISSFVGGFRWWRLQQGLLRGVGISGGGEILIVAGIVGVIIATTFGLVLAIDIDKEY